MTYWLYFLTVIFFFLLVFLVMTPLQGWCPLTSVEKVLLAVGVKAGHGNIPV